ncbi:NAD(P)-dependent oxidoreductase [Bacillus sp. Marseille-P3661]|uniref:NAD(P)-dependent oxidoreductase n=1 Tax=Bacillus sp. Marseille-P3661 TaxID=1936234 RepID=UPI000C832717|nr:NAD(P)-dependent oxidoreductase [Bacillus sp. Marseille-P3661]
MVKNQKLSVGIIGVGRMGFPMGKHLLKQNFPLYLYDPDVEKLVELEKMGAQIMSSPKELASQVDVAIVITGFANQVVDALTGESGFFEGARAGTIAVISSTISPELTRSLAEQGSEKDVNILDAPVARGEKGAIEANLLWFVGGDSEVLERAKPVLSACGPDIHHLGGLGAGQVGKTINNMLLWACLVADHEGLALAEKYGVETESLRQALLISSGKNWALENWEFMKNIPWAQKDMGIVLEMADSVRLSMPMAGFIKERVKVHQYEAGF